MPRPPYETPTEADIAAVSEQLGREARGVIGIAARASDGSPAVVATAPRLPDGSPFPTFYYLCHPEAVAAAKQAYRAWSRMAPAQRKAAYQRGTASNSSSDKGLLELTNSKIHSMP